MPRSQALLRLAQVSLGLVLGLGLAELAFWLRDDGAFPHLNIYVPDAELGARLRPDARTRVAVGPNPVTSVRTNDQGFRGADWGPGGEGEILVVGDSQVFGLGVEEEETFSARLAEGTGRVVRNAGQPTHGPDEYLAIAAEQLALRPVDTLVLVVNFANDSFELARPNRERHAVWDGWAVRIEHAPSEAFAFPGRGWVFGRSHAVYAFRRWWHGPLEQVATASEGSWDEVLAIAAEASAQAEQGEQAQQEVVQAKQARVKALSEPLRRGGTDYELQRIYVELVEDSPEQLGGNPVDILQEQLGESARPIEHTAWELRSGVESQVVLTQRLARWAKRHPRDARAVQIEEVLAAREAAAAALGEEAREAPVARVLESPFSWVLDRARALGKAHDAEVVVVALPLDVQVSEAEWAKYGSEPQDMSSTRAMLTELVAEARSRGMRGLDLTAALEAAEPGAFLDADLHLTPKGHAAVAEALAATLAEEAPLARPPPGLDPTRSLAPTEDEWKALPENTVKGSSKARCLTQAVREWQRLLCTGKADGSDDLPETRGVIFVDAPREAVARWSSGSMELVTPMLPGRALEVDLVWADRTERLSASWEGEQPRLSMTRTGPAQAVAGVEQAHEPAYRRVTFGGVSASRCLAEEAAAEAAGEPSLDTWDCLRSTWETPPTCPEGEAQAGSAGHCQPLCDEVHPCAAGACTDWLGAGVCL